MTVCIAAACNGGRHVICATDGMLSDMLSSLSGDVMATKLMWFGDWLFMFAGHLSEADLIMEELRLEARDQSQFLSRENIQSSVRSAYKKRFSKWSADRFLSHYDMDMEDFKNHGREMFGEDRFAELSRSMEQDALNYQEQILIVGWGLTEHAVMIFGALPDGVASFALDGFATTGSGAQVARSVLLSLECSRLCSTEEALYAVAAAKFSAESCSGVGKSTTMFVSHKRCEKDAKDKPPGHFIQPDEIDALRSLWTQHSKPVIPKEAFPTLCEIAQRIGAQTIKGMIETIQGSMQEKDGPK